MWECYTWIWTWVGFVNSTHNIFSLKCFAPTTLGIWHGNMGGVVQSEVVFPMPYFLLWGHSIQRILSKGLRHHEICLANVDPCAQQIWLDFDSIMYRSVDKSVCWCFFSMGRGGCEHGRPGGCIFKRPGWNPLSVQSEGTSEDYNLVYGEKQAHSHSHFTLFSFTNIAKWVIIMKKCLGLHQWHAVFLNMDVLTFLRPFEDLTKWLCVSVWVVYVLS